MNEMQFIRREMAAQRRHAREVAASWISLPEAFYSDILNTYDSYFLLILDLELSRIGSHLERLRPRSDLSDAERALLTRCARELETLAADRARASAADAGDNSTAASRSTSAAAITRDAVARNADLSARLSALVEELEAVAQSRYGVEDWRRAAHVDADSILEERRLRTLALSGAHGTASG